MNIKFGLSNRPRPRYQVYMSGSKWIVENRGEKLRSHDNKQDAVKYARKKAKQNKPSKLEIYDVEGLLITRHNYE